MDTISLSTLHNPINKTWIIEKLIKEWKIIVFHSYLEGKENRQWNLKLTYYLENNSNI